ncbi:hypothetical protein PR048_006521 [Dryococelus australis]|uniref:Uncharacterized protein n=1 Tax=Dryococelus australis TaxID=614101 RepID=A0ABQ9ICI2_9NEOP|nr:hypothetical protein PR048_006521 [Dryococelus australis]
MEALQTQNTNKQKFAPRDADVEIVKAEVKASLIQTTTLIGEDIDLLVLLLYCAQPDSKNLYFRSDKSRVDGAHQVYDIKHIKKILGNDTQGYICLYVCNTKTSAPNLICCKTSLLQSILPDHGMDGDGRRYECHKLGGGNLQDKQYVPLMSSKNIAPDSLLKVIHCNCSTNCKTFCCSCRRYRLSCTTACELYLLKQCDNPHKLLPELLDGDNEY